MNRFLLSVFFGFAVAGCGQTAPSPPATGKALQAFLPQWEEAQSRFINGDPSLWKELASHRDDA